MPTLNEQDRFDDLRAKYAGGYEPVLVGPGGTIVAVQAGTHAARPAAGTVGRLYYETDTKSLFYDNGSAWDGVGGSGGGSLASLSDVTLTTPAAGDGFQFNGTVWVNTASLDANARVGVRKNTGASTFKRRRLNLIEGTGVTLTVADDSGNEEVDVTVAAAGGTGPGGTVPYWVSDHPDTPPGSANTEDDEFESATLAGKWTQTLTGTPTISIHGTWLSCYWVTFSATGQAAQISQSFAPSGAFNVTAHMYGKCLGTGQMIVYALDAGGTNGAFAKYAIDSFSLMTEDAGAFTTRSTISSVFREHLFMSIGRDGSNNWTALMSDNGRAWYPTGSFGKTFTVASIGVQFNNGTGGTKQMGLDWFRRDWRSPLN